MQSLKSIRLAEVDNFFKQSFEEKKLIPLYLVRAGCKWAAKKKMHAGYREKERLGNQASNP